ncbi:Cyclic di-GMP phosphodiesterase Gmr [Devosia equisanguinis]|uniref:Cyclic di-GMP phosphodiesterase Gmr n=1 Tax=Devosia equisanguinis TaxID=2490941 RepID=A0A447I9P9_9HYPH|nr:EAL domain-containing protein [Devosia equisanguinis]VDS04154.1 Cyclic di-GMP phosphodiesterase Gmr [Devosia equisanguinis]
MSAYRALRQQDRDRRRTIAVPTLIAMITVIVVGLFIDRQSQQISEARIRSDVLAELSVIRAKLEGNISSNIQLVRGLVATISTEPDMDQARYDALVKNIFSDDSQLRSVAAAPDLVIRMTYPLAGNEAAIGLDYRRSPQQWEAVERVRRTGKLSMAGPIELVQGGTGLVGRFPVYAGDDTARRFWGVVSAVVDVDRLYAASGLSDPDLKLQVAITGRDGKGATGDRFYGPDLSALNPVMASVVLPSGTWQLTAVPKSGWAPDPASLGLQRAALFAGGGLIMLAIFMASAMAADKHVHIGELRARETELVRLTRRLNLALHVSKVGVWDLNMATGEENWDGRTNEIYGLPDDRAARRHEHWLAAIHPDDRERAEEEFARMIGSGRYESQYRVIWPDGSIHHVRSMGVLYREDDDVSRVIGANWDVTEDVARNEDLHHAKQITEARNAELEAARVRIEFNALHDSLTGLPNRRYLDEVLRRNAAHGYLGSGGIALLHIDLDRFKQINDTLGHAAGDAMLIHASQVLKAHCRSTDFVARIGGDEFVIVSTAGMDDQPLSLLAGRIVTEMRKPAMHEGHECRFGVSVGVAAVQGPDIDVKQLLINADIALYRAKARGRNRYEFFSEALQAEVIGNKRIADDILVGLETDAFIAHYQPQFDARTYDLVGVEALARWQHPTEGLKTPDYFLDVAEELNVVSTIDRIVLDQALRDLAHWDRAGIKVPRVSVNVSLRRLHDDRLIASLREMNIAPGRIAFELVESIYLDENDGVVSWNIEHIKELGIDVEIDDFGTGYASIVSLQKLHPARLKIDKQLVAPIIEQPAQRRLVSSIVDIGKSMDIEIVAEGVETMEHAAILRDLGCDILQGYAFARPMDRTQLEAFIGVQAWRRTA